MVWNGSRAVLLGALLLVFAAWPADPARSGSLCVCGDGEPCEGEACDDGNTVSGDGCSDPSCLPEVCGDGVTNPDPAPGPGEECDDGNTSDDDGCTAPDCQFDCGDGELDASAAPAEVCDDGNQTNGDGCDDDPSATSPGNCTVTACGNGVIAGIETCDDGNTVSGDGCDASCIIVDGFLTRKQQACINAVNKNLAGVARAQGGEISKCVKDAAAGNVADVLTCLVEGPKTTKAGEVTTRTVTGRKCTGEGLPPFAFTDAPTVNGAGSDQVLEGANALLGSPPAIAPKASDKAGAACQGEVIRQYDAVLGKWLGEAVKAKKNALKGGKRGTPSPAGSPAELATGIDAAVTDDAGITRAEARAGTRIGRKCEGVSLEPLFDCGDTATDVASLTACVLSEAKRAACEALEAADSLDLTCP